MARRLIRKRFILLSVLALLMGLVLSPNPWRDRAAGWGVKKLFHRVLGREVSWSSLRLTGLPPHLEVRDLAVSPLVRVRFLSIVPSTTLLSTGIFISGLEVDLSGAIPAGPSGAPKGRSLSFLFFHRLTVVDARIKLKETTIPLSGDFRQVSLFTSGDRGFLWVRRGRLDIQEYPPVELTLRVGFRPDGEALHLEPLVVKGPDFSIGGSGRAAGRSPYLDLALKIEAPLRPWLDRFEAEIDAEARARLDASLRLEEGGFHLRGGGEVTGAALFHHALEPFGLEFALESAGPVRVLDATARGSRGTLEAHLDLHPPVEVRAGLDLAGVSLARILSTFSVPVPAYDLPVDVRGDFAFRGSAIADGAGALSVSGGGGRFGFEAGLRGLGFEFFTARLRDAGLDLDASGSLPFNDHDPVRIDGILHRTDLESMQRFLSPFLPEFGELSGCVEGRFSMGRTFGDPLMEVEADLERVRLFGLDWGSGPIAFTVTGEEPFAVSRLALSQEGGSITAEGALGGGFDFRFDAWPWTLPLPMTLSGTGRMELEPAFGVRGVVDRAEIAALPFDLDRVNAGFDYDGTTLRLDPVEASAGDGGFLGSGEFIDRFRLAGVLRDFPLAEGVTADGDLELSFGEGEDSITGRVRMAVEGEGPPFPLRVDAALGGRDGRLSVETRSFGTLEARLDQASDGTLSVEGMITGVGLEDLPVRIDPPASGTVRLSGDPFDPATWSGEVRFPPLEVSQGEFHYRVPGGLALALRDGAVSLEKTDIEHDWGFIEVSGRLRLVEGLPFEADLQAEFGDDLVQQFFPDFEYSGFAAMDLRAVRRERTLELSGGLRLDGFYLKVKPLRLLLENPVVRVAFNRNRITLERMEARTGEGRLTGSGEVYLGPRGNLLAANISFAGESLLLRYPEGFRLLLDGAGELILTPAGRTLSARVTLQEGLYTRDIDLVAELKRALSVDQFLPSASRLPDIRLAVDISIPGTLHLVNQLLEVTGGGRLQIVGSLPRPIVLGALETLPGSRVNFGGVQYQIIRANLQFNNPHGFDPAIDLLAEATIQNYLVRLALSGPISRLQTRLTSTPYLTEADIFSLLATGAPGRESQRAVAAGAASLLVSQQLSQRITSSTSNLLGLDRVRIDPVIGETSITGARLTVAKRITRDCLFSYTYTTDVNKQDIVSIECTVSGNAYLNLMQEDDGSYSLQLLKREKF